jgi:hypothetical protein
LRRSSNEILFARVSITGDAGRPRRESAGKDGIAINLTATGDLPGKVRLTLMRNDANVTGGTLLVTVSNANASSRARGSLTGTVSGGTLTLASNGTLASASNVQVPINRGQLLTAQFTTARVKCILHAHDLE